MIKIQDINRVQLGKKTGKMAGILSQGVSRVVLIQEKWTANEVFYCIYLFILKI